MNGHVGIAVVDSGNNCRPGKAFSILVHHSHFPPETSAAGILDLPQVKAVMFVELGIAECVAVCHALTFGERERERERGGNDFDKISLKSRVLS